MSSLLSSFKKRVQATIQLLKILQSKSYVRKLRSGQVFSLYLILKPGSFKILKNEKD
jgi:hypothetical protein